VKKTSLRPQNGKDRKQLRLILGACLGAVLAVAGLWSVQYFWHSYRVDHWQTCTGTVLDVRPILMTQASSERGAAMLYGTEVLVGFEANGFRQERWVFTRYPPATIEEVQSRRLLWKGTQCVIRRNPESPAQIDAEL
jgi:hypothetical protein